MSKTGGKFACRRAEVLPLGPGERRGPYSADCALCECEPVALLSSIPVVPVAHGKDAAGVRYTRCLRCGLRWTARSHRWKPSKILPSLELVIASPAPASAA